MRNLIFLIIPIVFTAYALNKWVITNEDHQWVIYFGSDGLVDIVVGALLMWNFYKMRMKLHVLAAGWFLVISLFNLISEVLGQRSIGDISEPIWVGLCMIATLHLLWKYSKNKNQKPA